MRIGTVLLSVLSLALVASRGASAALITNLLGQGMVVANSSALNWNATILPFHQQISVFPGSGDGSSAVVDFSQTASTLTFRWDATLSATSRSQATISGVQTESLPISPGYLQFTTGAQPLNFNMTSELQTAGTAQSTIFFRLSNANVSDLSFPSVTRIANTTTADADLTLTASGVLPAGKTFNLDGVIQIYAPAFDATGHATGYTNTTGTGFFQLTMSVPEPTSLAMVAVGAFAMRRRVVNGAPLD